MEFAWLPVTTRATRIRRLPDFPWSRRRSSSASRSSGKSRNRASDGRRSPRRSSASLRSLFGLCLLSYQRARQPPGRSSSASSFSPISACSRSRCCGRIPSRIAGPAAAGVFVILSAWTAWNLRHAFPLVGARRLSALRGAARRVSRFGRSARTRSEPSASHGRATSRCSRSSSCFSASGAAKHRSRSGLACCLINVIAVAMAASVAVSRRARPRAHSRRSARPALWIVTAPPIHESVVGSSSSSRSSAFSSPAASTFLSRQPRPRRNRSRAATSRRSPPRCRSCCCSC